jgi:hypothetical protein
LTAETELPLTIVQVEQIKTDARNIHVQVAIAIHVTHSNIKAVSFRSQVLPNVGEFPHTIVQQDFAGSHYSRGNGIQIAIAVQVTKSHASGDGIDPLAAIFKIPLAVIQPDLSGLVSCVGIGLDKNRIHVAVIVQISQRDAAYTCDRCTPALGEFSAAVV